MITSKTLYEQIQNEPYTGNTTWIIKAAKQNPECRIMFLHQQLADSYKSEYIKWFVSSFSRQPERNELPLFISVGSRTTGNHSPLIIDNSCLDMQQLEAYLKEVIEKLELDVERTKRAMYKERKSIVRGIIDEIIQILKPLSIWDFLFHWKETISQINHIKYRLDGEK